MEQKNFLNRIILLEHFKEGDAIMKRKLFAILILSFIVILMISLTTQKPILLGKYQIIEKLYTSTNLNPSYCGPIFATGGAMSDIKRYIKDMPPERIGKFEKKTITLFEPDSSQDMKLNFKKISAYRIFSKNDTFNILHIKCRDNYDIVIELQEGSNYDRSIWIYKKGEPKVLILTIDNIRIKQKNIHLKI
jgi:hypothetical protein